MTESIKAEERTVPTPALNTVRQTGKVPAELYGHGFANRHLFVNKGDFEKVHATAKESSLVDLVLGESKPIKVLIQQVDADPLSGAIIHADLLQVKMDEVIHTSIPLEFIGECKAVKELGGTLVKSLEEVEVSCLPADLIPHLEVDISSLNTFEDAIRVSGLKFPSGIKVENEPETTVATVQPQRVEVEQPAAEPPAPEVIGKEKPESEAEEQGKEASAKGGSGKENKA